MSDLFRLEIVDVSSSTARIRARTVHPDQSDVSAEKNFALQVVVEAYELMKGRHLIGEQPIDPDEAQLRAAAHPKRHVLERLLVMMRGRDVEISRAEYESLRAETTRMRDAGIAALGVRDGRYTKTHATEYAAFVAEAERLVSSVVLEDEIDHPRGEPDDGDAEATIAVTVTEPGLLAHLAPGLWWSSAAYDFRGW